MAALKLSFFARAGWLALACGFASPAGAVFTFGPLAAYRQLTLRVGSTGSTVDTVVFDISGASVWPSPAPVQGVPNGPSTSPAGGVEIFMDVQLATVGLTSYANLYIDSSAGLRCVAGSGCGTTTIPFSNVSWMSYNRDTTYPGSDVSPDSFDDSSSQQIIGVSAFNQSATMSNVLTFSYANSFLYPAGRYSGRVVYTAVIL